MSLFVTGTDTGVGKTVVSALLLARYAAELELAYWKPVASGAGGSQPERDSAMIGSLAALVGAEVEIRLEMHLLQDPVSPHLAARREGVVIDLDAIAAAWAGWQSISPERGVVIEGAGGVMVPLNEKQRLGKGGGALGTGGFAGSPLGAARSAGGELLIDLIALLELPVLLVARTTGSGAGAVCIWVYGCQTCARSSASHSGGGRSSFTAVAARRRGPPAVSESGSRGASYEPCHAFFQEREKLRLRQARRRNLRSSAAGSKAAAAAPRPAGVRSTASTVASTRTSP